MRYTRLMTGFGLAWMGGSPVAVRDRWRLPVLSPYPHDAILQGLSSWQGIRSGCIVALWEDSQYTLVEWNFPGMG
jgi:hypothetical protein